MAAETEYFSQRQMNALFADTARRAGERARDLLKQHRLGDGPYFAGLVAVYTNEIQERIAILGRTLLPLARRKEIAACLPARAKECIARTVSRLGVPSERVEPFFSSMDIRIAALLAPTGQWEELVSESPRQLDTIEKRKAARYRILERAFDASEGDTHRHLNYRDIARNLGLPEQECLIEVRWLKNEGLLDIVAMGGEIALTHEGVKEIEAMRTNPQQATDYFPPLSQVTNVFLGPVGVAQSGSGSIEIRDSVLTALGQIQDDLGAEFREAIQLLVNAVERSDHLLPDRKQAALELVEDLVEEAARERAHRRQAVAVAICSALGGLLSTAADVSDLWERVEPIVSGLFQ